MPHRYIGVYSTYSSPFTASCGGKRCAPSEGVSLDNCMQRGVALTLISYAFATTTTTAI